MGMQRPPSGVPNAPATGWQVTSQQPWQEIGADGRVVQGIRVYFKTAGGVSHWAFVPMERYSPDNVRAEIAPLAAQLDQVQQLKG